MKVVSKTHFTNTQNHKPDAWFEFRPDFVFSKGVWAFKDPLKSDIWELAEFLAELDILITELMNQQLILKCVHKCNQIEIQLFKWSFSL